MSDKPEALRLAAALEQGKFLLSVERDATAAELRRLSAVEIQRNELLEALKLMRRWFLDTDGTHSMWQQKATDAADAAVVKAMGGDNA